MQNIGTDARAEAAVGPPYLHAEFILLLPLTPDHLYLQHHTHLPRAVFVLLPDR